VEPNFGPSLLLGGEYYTISLLPYFLEDKSREKLPDMVENGIFEGSKPPTNNSIDNSFSITVEVRITRASWSQMREMKEH
jgi:hypothetical protein